MDTKTKDFTNPLNLTNVKTTIISSVGEAKQTISKNTVPYGFMIVLFVLAILFGFISIGLFFHKKPTTAIEMMGVATVFCYMIFCTHIQYTTENNTIIKWLVGVVIMLTMFSFIMGNSEDNKKELRPSSTSVRRAPVQCAIYLISLLGLCLFTLRYKNKFNTPSQRIMASGAVLVFICVMIGVFMAIGFKYPHKSSLLKVYWENSLAPMLLFFFILSYRWIGQAFYDTVLKRPPDVDAFTGDAFSPSSSVSSSSSPASSPISSPASSFGSPTHAERIRECSHKMLLYTKLACVFILFLMTLINNSDAYSKGKNKGAVAGMGVLGFLLGVLVAKLYISGTDCSAHDPMKNILTFFMSATFFTVLFMSIPVSPFVAKNPGKFVGVVVLIAVCAFIFMCGLVWSASEAEDRTDTFKANWSNIGKTVFIAVVMYILLETSGFLLASMDKITAEEENNEEDDTKKKDETNQTFSERLLEYETATYNEIYLGAGIMGFLIMIFLLLILMSVTHGLILHDNENKTSSSFLPIRFMFIAAIAFSILMNFPYIAEYVFITQWVGRTEKVKLDKSFAFEFFLVCLKFILFFYVLVGIQLIVVNAPNQHMETLHAV